MRKKILLSVLGIALYAQAFAVNGQVDILVTDGGQKIEVSNVDYLLAADDDTHFQIVLKAGDPILNVIKVTFEKGSSGIESVAKENSKPKIVGEVRSTLTLSGCRNGAKISVFNLSGTCVLQTVATDSTVLDVNGLPAGCYILDVEGNAVKFIKK